MNIQKYIHVLTIKNFHLKIMVIEMLFNNKIQVIFFWIKFTF
jgi:hypothetical protein